MTDAGYLAGFSHDWPEEVRADVAATTAIWACTSGTMTKHLPTMQESSVFKLVTLGLGELARKEKWFFSSCAFLPLFVLECLGFNEAHNLSRDDNPETAKVEPNNPLSRLAWHKASRPVIITELFEAGDTIQIGSNGDSHVQMCLAQSTEDNLLVAQYGLGAPYGGDVQMVKVSREKTLRQWVGNRPARRVLKLKSLFAACSKESMRQAQIPIPVWEELSGATRNLLTRAPEVG